MPTFPANTPLIERHIAFFLFEDVKLLDATGPLQVFADANEVLGYDAYITTLASHHGGPVKTDTGTLLNTRRVAGVGLDETDTLIVCGGDGVHAASRDHRLVASVLRATEKCGRIAAT